MAFRGFDAARIRPSRATWTASPATRGASTPSSPPSSPPPSRTCPPARAPPATPISRAWSAT
ncbi:hypothetical protein ACFQVA_24410 [Actinomadura keratinilytica]